MIELESKVLVDGLGFAEGPRWHNGLLWFSDIPRDTVLTCDVDGNLTKVVDVPREEDGSVYWGPSGLGFLPDDSLLISMMSARKILRYDGKDLTVHADLSSLVEGQLNDMVVDGKGRAYVGARKHGVLLGTADGFIVLVEPDGKARIVADDIPKPNGTVVSPDGTLLVVANSFTYLTAAEILEDGSLGSRQMWADLSVDGAVRRRLRAGDLDQPVSWADLGASVGGPDGIALDADGAIWVGCPGLSKFIRVEAGGNVTHTIYTPGKLAVACALGGEDRRTLFLTTAGLLGEIGTRGDLLPNTVTKIPLGETTSWIETAQVEVPGAGWP